MVAKKFWVLTLEAVSPSEENLLTSLLFEQGATGVQEDLQFQQKDRKYLPEVCESSSKTLLAYFEESPQPSLQEELQQQFPHVQHSLSEEVDRDWLEEWKKNWQPFCLWNDIWVVPSWLEDSFDSSGKHILRIDPGMAFGTGTHATTQIASQLIGECLAEKPTPSSIDVGTGSGILALLMRHLGVDRVYAYDNDDESERVFLENLEKNKATAIDWVENWPELGSTDLQLVVANIIDGVLIELKESFMKLSRPGHRYIFTGILKEREQDFLKEMMQDWSLTLVQKIEKEEWVGFCFEVSS